MKYFRIVFFVIVFSFFFLVLTKSYVSASSIYQYDWTKTIGQDGDGYSVGLSVTEDYLSNLYIIGNFYDTVNFNPGGTPDNHTSNGAGDVFVTKNSSNGSYSWTKTFGGTANDGGWGIVTDNQGNIYISGYFHNTVDFDPSNGVDNHTSNGAYDIYLTKYNSDGSYGWTKTFGGSGDDRAYSMTFDKQGGLYLTGAFQDTVNFNPGGIADIHTSNGDDDVYVTKYNIDGDYLWTKTFGDTYQDISNSVTIDNKGNIYLTGFYYNTVNFNPTGVPDNHTSNGGSDVFVTKYNSNESYGWTKTFGGTSNDNGYSIATDNFQNVYITGEFQNTVDFNLGGISDSHISNGSGDVFITKYNTDGNNIWTKTFGGSGTDWAQSISADNLGNTFVSGGFSGTVNFNPGGTENRTTQSSWGDTFISSFDSNGNFQWVHTISSNDYAYPDGDKSMYFENTTKNLYAVGEFGEITDFDPYGSHDIKTYANDGGYIIKLTVDSDAPTIMLDLTPASITSPNLNITGVATDVLGTVKSVEYQLDSYTGTWSNCSANDGTYNQVSENFTCSLTGLTDGAHKIYIRATDSLNNTTLSTNLTEVDITVSPTNTTSVSKPVITNIGLISNVANQDLLSYYFTSQTPRIQGTSDIGTTVYFVTNGNTYQTTTDSSGKYSLVLYNPSLPRTKNTIVYYAKDQVGNKSAERTLVLIVGEENFPVAVSSDTTDTSVTVSTTASSDLSTSSLASLSTSSSTSSPITTQGVTVKVLDVNGNIVSNALVTINGVSVYTDVLGVATFSNLTPGTYDANISYNGINTTQTVTLTNNPNTINLTNSSTGSLPILPIVLIGGALLLLIVILLVVGSRKRS